jgi:RNA polymerase sigma-70 factor (ECF subfamily)
VDGCVFLIENNATGCLREVVQPREEEQREEESLSAREDQFDVERVLAGDLSAFERIVLRWQNPLVNLAFRFCRDRGRAEEMAQEAFLRAYRGLSSWRKDSAFSTWLFTLAMNLYRTELKKIPSGIVELDRAAEAAGASFPFPNAANEDRTQVVREAVLTLPAKYRDSLTLYYFQEMDVPAAARALNLPEGTVKARLFRGREMLKAKLERRLGDLRLKEV